MTSRLFWGVFGGFWFLSPWIHRAVFENLKAADPDIKLTSTDLWITQLVCTFFAVIIYAALKDTGVIRDKKDKE